MTSIMEKSSLSIEVSETEANRMHRTNKEIVMQEMEYYMRHNSAPSPCDLARWITLLKTD